MNDLISRSALMEYPLQRGKIMCHEARENQHFLNGVASVLEYAQNLPTVPAEVVRHGRWEQMGERPGLVFFTCTACGWSHEKSLWNPLEKTRNYCPNCGCCMDGKEDSR